MKREIINLMYQLFGTKKARLNYAEVFFNNFCKIDENFENELDKHAELFIKKFHGLYAVNSKAFSLENFNKINENILIVLFSLLPTEVVEKVDLDSYDSESSYSKFLSTYGINEESFINTLNMFKDENKKYFLDGRFKNDIRQIKNTLPTSSLFLFKIFLGEVVKSDGTVLTLEDFSKITNSNLELLEDMTSDIKNLVVEKIKRKVAANGK